MFKPSLVGQWTEDESEATWTFSKEGTNAYTLIYNNKNGKQGAFSAHLLKIKGELFIDFFPKEPELKRNNFYKLHLLPVHTFVHVNQIEPTLQMAAPNPKWIEKYLAENPSAIRHEKVDGEIVLTAPTKDLQAFWLKHLDTEDAFGDPTKMKRSQRDVPKGNPNKPDAGDGK